MDQQHLIEAREHYRSCLRCIWGDSLHKPTTKSDIHFWIRKANLYIKKLLALGDLIEDEDTNLIFIVKMSHYRLQRDLEILSRV